MFRHIIHITLLLSLLLGCTDQLPTGLDVPNDVYAIIEISADNPPVKYEMHKQTGTLIVDRFLPPHTQYPANYGFIPNTLSKDGDPVDVLVISPFPVLSGAALRVRPIGVLNMEDEAGMDAKIIAVPVHDLSREYDAVQSVQDLDPALVKRIESFFTYYKANEPGKWVKIIGWGDADAARHEIQSSVKRS